MSVQTRASLALTATTTLEPDFALTLVKSAASRVKGGGASLLTTGIANLGAEVHVERESAGKLVMSITSGKRVVELCTFTATAVTEGGTTSLTVGGLDRYKTSQSTVLGFIPAGPKMIAGMAPYKRLLQHIEAELRQEDASCDCTIAESPA